MMLYKLTIFLTQIRIKRLIIIIILSGLKTKTITSSLSNRTSKLNPILILIIPSVKKSSERINRNHQGASSVEIKIISRLYQSSSPCSMTS